ncbi:MULTISPECIES: DotG/IcmE/VirB10 family protein [Cysteiniphilum]|uniref:Uncharacterized protein n=1 Tax=Cysteiniphilum litorale TaxID=2056700 RepID=A0A8J2Z389_9GAMM|nr:MULTISPECIES: DotG/IcmE/VirB10 family protein [Cysteiniphilum]GGF91725.1 hypothetical protein GCM10010995_06160 [Cysteiniphilum litorale]
MKNNKFKYIVLTVIITVAIMAAIFIYFSPSKPKISNYSSDSNYQTAPLSDVKKTEVNQVALSRTKKLTDEDAIRKIQQGDDHIASVINYKPESGQSAQSKFLIDKNGCEALNGRWIDSLKYCDKVGLTREELNELEKSKNNCAAGKWNYELSLCTEGMTEDEINRLLALKAQCVANWNVFAQRCEDAKDKSAIESLLKRKNECVSKGKQWNYLLGLCDIGSDFTNEILQRKKDCSPDDWNVKLLLCTSGMSEAEIASLLKNKQSCEDKGFRWNYKVQACDLDGGMSTSKLWSQIQDCRKSGGEWDYSLRMCSNAYDTKLLSDLKKEYEICSNKGAQWDYALQTCKDKCLTTDAVKFLKNTQYDCQTKGKIWNPVLKTCDVNNKKEEDKLQNKKLECITSGGCWNADLQMCSNSIAPQELKELLHRKKQCQLSGGKWLYDLGLCDNQLSKEQMELLKLKKKSCEDRGYKWNYIAQVCNDGSADIQQILKDIKDCRDSGGSWNYAITKCVNVAVSTKTDKVKETCLAENKVWDEKNKLCKPNLSKLDREALEAKKSSCIKSGKIWDDKQLSCTTGNKALDSLMEATKKTCEASGNKWDYLNDKCIIATTSKNLSLQDQLSNTCELAGFKWVSELKTCSNNFTEKQLADLIAKKRDCLSKGYDWDYDLQMCTSDDVAYYRKIKNKCISEGYTWDTFQKKCNGDINSRDKSTPSKEVTLKSKNADQLMKEQLACTKAGGLWNTELEQCSLEINDIDANILIAQKKACEKNGNYWNSIIERCVEEDSINELKALENDKENCKIINGKWDYLLGVCNTGNFSDQYLKDLKLQYSRCMQNGYKWNSQLQMCEIPENRKKIPVLISTKNQCLNEGKDWDYQNQRCNNKLSFPGVKLPDQAQQALQQLLGEAKSKVSDAYNNMSNEVKSQVTSAPFAINIVTTPQELEKMLQNNAIKNKGVVEGGKKEAIVLPSARFYAVLLSSVNSDYTKIPVTAEIVSGVLRGARILGTFTLPKWTDSITLEFTKMVYKGDVYDIDAVAFDISNMQPGLSDDVDNHYLFRYGSLGLATILSGYAEVMQGVQSTQVLTQNGTQSIVQQLPSPTDQVFMSVGKGASHFIKPLSENINRPPTVTVDTGRSFGLYFISPVYKNGSKSTASDTSLIKDYSDKYKGVIESGEEKIKSLNSNTSSGDKYSFAPDQTAIDQSKKILNS